MHDYKYKNVLVENHLCRPIINGKFEEKTCGEGPSLSTMFDDDRHLQGLVNNIRVITHFDFNNEQCHSKRHTARRVTSIRLAALSPEREGYLSWLGVPTLAGGGGGVPTHSWKVGTPHPLAGKCPPPQPSGR